MSARPDLRIQLLGSFGVTVGGRAVPEAVWRRRTAKSLVKILGLAPQHRRNREEIMESLWPHLGAHAAANNLRQTLYAARRALRARSPAVPHDDIQLLGDLVVLSTDGSVWIDVDAFAAALANARATHDVADYRAALDLYRGDLLPDDQYEDWVVPPRDQLRASYHAALLEVARLLEASGDPRGAIEHLRTLVERDPANEEARRRLMRLYAATRERGRALEQYEALRATLRRELAVDPDPATARLAAAIREGKLALTALVLPAGGPGARRHNVPVALTSFVGRAREMAEVRDLLARAHLVTITGTGGCGKTRLAREVARGLTGRFPDGAWMVDLAGVADPLSVGRAVAEALDVREESGRPLDGTIAEHLRAKRVLLLLDSCDRVIDRCATLAAGLLAAAPDLRVLATSREPLRCEGEAVLPVPPLGLPQATRRATVEDLMRHEAVRLFVERAQLADPRFALTAANADAVVRVCRQLDGMPLAIELAAARIRSLPPEALAEHLEDRLRLLALGTRTAVSRHATLAAAIDHSHDLLDDWERALFRRLAVFVGGWTIDAARDVAGFSGVPSNEVAELLARLVDRSLTTVEADASGDVRYGFLETLRAYASERLDASHETETVRGRHAGSFRDLAERSVAELDGGRQASWLGRLEREHNNLRAALRWSIDRADADTALRLVAALAPFWLRHSDLGEGRKWLEEALALGSDGPPLARARALAGIGALARRQDDYAGARSRYEEGLAMFRELGDRSGTVECLLGLALLAMSAGDHARARSLAEEALAIERGIGAGRDRALYVLGRLALDLGDPREARSRFEEALGDARARGDQFAVAGILVLLGLISSDADELVTARERLVECVDIYRRLGNRQELAYSLRNLGAIGALQGDHRSAHALLAESLATCRDLGDALGIALALEELAVLAAARGRAGRALRLLGAAQAQRERIGRDVAPSRATVLERRLASARAMLSADRRETLLASGRGLDLDRAAGEAMSEADA